MKTENVYLCLVFMLAFHRSSSLRFGRRYLSSAPGPAVNALNKAVDLSILNEGGLTSKENGPPLAGPLTKPKKKLVNTRALDKEYRIYSKTSRNNTIITLTNEKGDAIVVSSAGTLGFKGANRSSYEAGYACALHVLKRVLEENEKHRFTLQILLNGFGHGRDAIYRALLTAEMESIKRIVTRVTDRTPLAIGGVRPKKRRRL
jgi:small subunit ribosomal protein S11